MGSTCVRTDLEKVTKTYDPKGFEPRSPRPLPLSIYLQVLAGEYEKPRPVQYLGAERLFLLTVLCESKADSCQLSGSMPSCD